MQTIQFKPSYSNDLSEVRTFVNSKYEGDFKTILSENEPLKFMVVELQKGLLISFKENQLNIYTYSHTELLNILQRLKKDFELKNYYVGYLSDRVKELKILIDSKKPNKIKEIRKFNKYDNKEVVLKVGDYLYTSWGYDQTNNEFFKVIKILGKNYFLIKEVGCKSLEDNGEFKQYDKIAITGEELNEMPKKAFISNDGYMSISEKGYKRSLWIADKQKVFYPTNTIYGH